MAARNVIDAYEALDDDEKNIVRASVVPAPSQGVANGIWIVIFVILGGVIFIGGWLGIDRSGSDETALYGFVGIALGAVVGLLAPSPASSSK